MLDHTRATWPRAAKFALLPLALAAMVSHSSTLVVNSSQWAPTDARAFVLSGMTDLGAADAGKALTLVVTMRLQNKAQLDLDYAHITTAGDPRFGHYLSAKQFADSYAPTMTQISAVSDYLVSKGFRNLELSGNRMQLRMTGTVAQAQSAFNTTLHNFSYNGATVVSNTTAAQVPAALGTTVLGVVGLSTVPTNFFRHPKPAAQPAVGAPTTKTRYTPAQFQTAFDVGATPDGSKVNIAIIAQGNLDAIVGTHGLITDPTDPNFDKAADLRLAEIAHKQPIVPVTVVKVGKDHTDTSGADEWDLDTQHSSGMANNVKMMYVYDVPTLFDFDIMTADNQFASDNLAMGANSSFGQCDSLEQSAGTLGAYEQAFLQMAMQGQTMFASTGDNGSGCGTPSVGAPGGGIPGVGYPAASPNVVGVGGTDLTTNADGTYDVEIAWQGTGGGTSPFLKSPAWVSKIMPGGNPAGTRAIPDIAMPAGDTSSGEVYVGGKATGVEGTSMSSPLSLGVWARLQSARVAAGDTSVNPSPLGFAAPVLYTQGISATDAAAGKTTTFHDILAGNNGTYVATPGWDYISGMGSFDIAKVHAALAKVSTFSLIGGPAQARGGDVCALPGNRVSLGTVGSNADATNGANTSATQKSHNVTAAYVSEHYDLAANKVDGYTFTMDVGAVATGGQTVYIMYFQTPDDGVRHFVAYEPTPDPAGKGDKFSYGHLTETDVPPPGTLPVGVEEGFFFPLRDGVTTGTLPSSGTQVSIFLPRSAVPTVTPGKQLTQIYGEVDAEGGYMDQGAENDLNALNSTDQGLFTPDAPNFCAPAPIAALTATPTTLFAGSAVAFDASTSTATIGPVTSYTFDFGDGTKATQKAATANHVYTTAGKYTASVSVVDSNQKTSTNAATQAITVNAPMVDKFGFAARTGADVSTVVTSEAVTISGTAGASFPISISGGTNAQYSVDGGPFTSDPGTIKAGQKLVVRQTSSSAYTTKTTETVTVGTYSTTFDVTTKDKPATTTPTSGSGSTGSGSTGTGTGSGTTTAGADHVPDAFDFGETDGVNPGVAYTSKAIVPQNYDDAPITATQLSYSIDGGAFTTAKGTIKKGQTVRVQMTSSKASLGYAKGYITIGGVKGYYTLRTKK